jgi:hypothetical protein
MAIRNLALTYTLPLFLATTAYTSTTPVGGNPDIPLNGSGCHILKYQMNYKPIKIDLHGG